MHHAVFEAFAEICRRRGAGGRVLEVGAVPADDTLLCLPSLEGASVRVGVNREKGSRHRDFEILRIDANDLSRFADGSFDAVLSNATLEHDPYFWRSLAEMRRVTRSGGLMVIGVPGYTKSSVAPGLRRVVAGVPCLRRLFSSWLASTPTLLVHEFPGDYYRFSAQAVREVMFGGCLDVEVLELLVPPRLVGSGRVP